MALGILVVVAALTLYRGQRASHDRAADILRMHEAAAAALDLVGQQLQMAAFAPPGSAVGVGLFGCSQGRVVGSDDAPACESLASHSDGVLIRYAADVVATWPSSSGAPTDCQGQAAGAYVVDRFYAKASASTGEPELYCEGVGRQALPMVEGIERLRLAYWLDNAETAVNAASVPRERWTSVVAAEICVRVRGDPVTAGKGRSYVDCDGSLVVSTDSRARQAFWRRVAIRNAVTVDSGRPS
ncbi:Type IV Pilus-assembly protein W [Caballeronia arationis]|jgi:type IV pilus assembly protein PilW|uniref:Type IV Pilus-assembly protein W n=1 Tax=Caballeronia arationis TaxID=1777142 RepID=A0A7Z7IBX3_9BURK|nr:PilW family protein [Caballeronia arationis]SOE82582.1 Type IV Pilus-assembly protein W [Caballeronia arationis]